MDPFINENFGYYDGAGFDWKIFVLSMVIFVFLLVVFYSCGDNQSKIVSQQKPEILNQFTIEKIETVNIYQGSK